MAKKIKIGEYKISNDKIIYSVFYDGEDWYPYITIKAHKGSFKNGVVTADIYLFGALELFLDECRKRVECIIAKHNKMPVAQFRESVKLCDNSLWNCRFFVEK